MHIALMVGFRLALLSLPAIAALGTGAVLASPAIPNTHELLISTSDQGIYQPQPAPWLGDQTFYIWALDRSLPSTGSEFALVATNLEVVDLVPRSGVINEGTITSPILRYPSCFYDEVVAEIVLRDAVGTGGRVCFGPSDQNGVNCSFAGCVPEYTSHLYVGLASDGAPPCMGWDPSDDCWPIVSVEPSTWGRTKATYR